MSLGSLIIPICLEGLNMFVKFYVVEQCRTAEDLMFGREWQASYDCHIKWKQRRVMIQHSKGDCTIPLCDEESIPCPWVVSFPAECGDMPALCGDQLTSLTSTNVLTATPSTQIDEASTSQQLRAKQKIYQPKYPSKQWIAKKASQPSRGTKWFYDVKSTKEEPCGWQVTTKSLRAQGYYHGNIEIWMPSQKVKAKSSAMTSAPKPKKKGQHQSKPAAQQKKSSSKKPRAQQRWILAS